MKIFLTILILILILGVIILVHELGHFMWAKKFKVHIYEFSIGMGPILFSKKGKDKINYNLRLVPIGGFVAMAGEVYEDNDKIKKEDFMCNKPWWQRLIILAAGVVNNFILAILILFFISLIWGANTYTTEVKNVVTDSPAYLSGLQAGEKITKINGYKVSSWDVAQIVLYMKDNDNIYDFTVKTKNNEEKNYQITPEVVKNEDGNESKVFGIEIVAKETQNLWDDIGYAFSKFQGIINSMLLTIYGLFAGKISVNALSGPVGMYQVVGTSMSYGLSYVIYILGFLSINVGFINILPFPAFDGGHILFVLIEKIKGSPVNQKFESTCHMIGFILLMILMLYVTIHDVIRII